MRPAGADPTGDLCICLKLRVESWRQDARSQRLGLPPALSQITITRFVTADTVEAKIHSTNHDQRMSSSDGRRFTDVQSHDDIVAADPLQHPHQQLVQRQRQQQVKRQRQQQQQPQPATVDTAPHQLCATSGGAAANSDSEAGACAAAAHRDRASDEESAGPSSQFCTFCTGRAVSFGGNAASERLTMLFTGAGGAGTLGFNWVRDGAGRAAISNLKPGSPAHAAFHCSAHAGELTSESLINVYGLAVMNSRPVPPAPNPPPP